MTETLQALILGAVQGLTEFLPVSSSGHLIIFPVLFGWEDQGLAFDAFVHLGTFFALVWYFRKDLVRLCEQVFKRDKAATDFVLRVGYATLPALILAYLLSDLIEAYLRSTDVVTASLIVWAIGLYLADRWSSKRDKHQEQYQHVTLKQAMIIGLLQPIALIPGTSRSGITITAGLLTGLSRKAAAKFSFFLGIPITGIAGVYGLLQSFGSEQAVSMKFSILGFASALLFGLFAIHVLISYLKKKRYTVFVVYRLLLALFLLAFVRVS